ncbi:unnamed protein product [Musa acuminata subsp. malaccensis]|uniref:(wild Malaysian banana) hypothetical protein n=1 Tax=Musa acuminata subsp. malaccensis TaxID=214687 RepID=A0A804KV29_MUSAM|nr:unnamed protein product [Musa acuminata subsp. malaccensis]
MHLILHCWFSTPSFASSIGTTTFSSATAFTSSASHPQALSECEHTLTALGLNVARDAFDDTAGAAEYVVANGLQDTAAIASARAAELYGLEVLADGIQDNQGNMTRFGTSVLSKVLLAFAIRDIGLTKIESRPHRQRPIRMEDEAGNGSGGGGGGGVAGTAKHFEYVFYVDFQASLAEPRAQNALAEVKEFSSFLRVLGSYPMDMTPT